MKFESIFSKSIMSSMNCPSQSAYQPVVIPPPPTLIDFSLKSRGHLRSNEIKKSVFDSYCAWAVDSPEIRQASRLAQVCTTTEPKYYRIKQNIKSVIQDGPTCGLTALTMLAGGRPAPSDILALAQRKHYTNHGEMFSAKNMCELTTSVFTLLGVSHNIEIHSGQLDCEHVRTRLMDGACILVAYDSDFNHAPCLKNGHKAHWALIVGCLIDDNDRFHVFVRHGKTKNLALWQLAALSESNSNLNEYTAPQRYDEYSFQMPVDGIAGTNGLKNQCVIINNMGNWNEFVCSYK